MTRPLVFVDTETTGLGSTARPWEVAIVRREVDGSERELVGQVAYGLADMAKMGASEEALRVGGWLHRGAPRTTYVGTDGEPRTFRYRDERSLALDLTKLFFHDEPLLVGVGVHFAAEILRSMFGRASVGASWHYGLLDLKAASWGHLWGQDVANGLADVDRPDAAGLPLSSEGLAELLGVVPPTAEERHTALGDVRWAVRWFDALTAGAR